MKNKQKMFLLEPFVSQKIWGREEWIVSTMEKSESFFYDQKKPVSINTLVGSSYPLLIKTINANETLSVQVHPDDEYALAYENSNGKTECWYILDANRDSTIISGLKGNLTKNELLLAIKENKIEKHLAEKSVKKGDFIFIPAGTVHAIKGGIRLLEIQQASDITYRMYDWGRNRELHIEKSLDVAKNFVSEPISNFSGFFECEYFSIEKSSVNSAAAIIPLEKNCWATYFIIEGSGTFSSENEQLKIMENSTVFVSPNTQISAVGNFSFFKISPKPTDTYSL